MGLSYWIETFLSRPDEVAAALLTLAVFVYAATRFRDHRDYWAVGLGVALVGATLALVGPPVALEWHYWLGGGLILGAAIVVVDRRRARARHAR